MKRQLRKSHEGIGHMVDLSKTYPNLPEELQPYQYYHMDAGYVIMAVPLTLLKKMKAGEALDDYEVGIPAKYVLEKGYTIRDDGYVIVDVPYDSFIGIKIPDGYEVF